MRLRFLIFVLLSSLGLAAACGNDDTSSGPGGSSGGCVDYSNVDVKACSGMPCSFANDIMPIFQGACAISASCHLSGNSPTGEGLGLGPGISMTPTQADIDAVYGAVVGQISVRSGLKLVEPGDPSRSWMMAKIDYADAMEINPPSPDFTDCPSLACKDTAKGCGERMPQTGPILEADSAPRRSAPGSPTARRTTDRATGEPR